MQDDVVMGTLTVRENLMFAADMRMPSPRSRKDREAVVDDLIRELGLENCADSKVGTPIFKGVSGGERKRCNIGTELVTRPKVIFLGEFSHFSFSGAVYQKICYTDEQFCIPKTLIIQKKNVMSEMIKERV